MSENMSHLEEAWTVRACPKGESEQENAPRIMTEGLGWYVATVHRGLPEDGNGRKTAQYICDLHNKRCKTDKNPSCHDGDSVLVLTPRLRNALFFVSGMCAVSDSSSLRELSETILHALKEAK